MTTTLSPTLLFVAGYAGSGKSMIGKILASKLQAPFLDKDTMCIPLLNEALKVTVGDPDDRRSDFYREHFKDREYECAIACAWENLRLTPTSIVVGPFSTNFLNKEWMGELDRQAKKLNGRWHVIWVDTSPDQALKMLKSRRKPRDIPLIENWATHVKRCPYGIMPPPIDADNYSVIKNDGRNLHDIAADIDALLVELGLTPTKTTAG